MANWSEAYSDLLASYVGQYKDARGNSSLRSEILAEVKSKILQHPPSSSVVLPKNSRVAIRREFLPKLDPEDRDDEENIIKYILEVTEKRKEDSDEGEDAREEKARPTKAGDYKKPFTAFTSGQRLFKDEMDTYDRERRDTKDPKTIGQRNKIIQQWWESLSDSKKAEAGRAVEKWNKLGAPKETHDSYRRKNFPGMAREFIDMVHRTMGSHIVMFAAHEAQDNQIKMAVFETQPQDGKKAFSGASEPSKDWVLKGEQILTDYLLTDPVEEDLNEEKKDTEITLDDDGNPEVPPWTGQKLKVQQNLARAVFQAAYAKFTQKPKAKVPWGLLIKSPLEYLDSESIPDGFVMKDPSKWTKADMRLLWNHWHSLEGQDKVIVTFIKCKKEDLPLGRFFDGKARSKKRVCVNIDDDSEGEAGVEDSEAGVEDLEAETSGRHKTLKVRVQDNHVSVASSSRITPHESSPAWHASRDRVEFLKSLSIMPRYQKLVELVVALPETETHISTEPALPEWALWTWGAKYLPEHIHLDKDSFLKALAQLEGEKFGSFNQGGPIVLGLGLLLRECNRAQEVEEDDPEVSHLDFLLNSNLGIQRAEDVLCAVGSVIARLEQGSVGMNPEEVDNHKDKEDAEKKAGGHAEERTASEGGGEEEEAPIQAPPKKRKRQGSKNTQEKAATIEDGEQKVKRDWKKSKRALGMGL
ncbi:hypothetical protein EDD15DRAFT_2378085 [Pisolithus albus]|nr:hypothetical protein EDD15DRAFT_2378085 [Pisolithus albus]